MVVRGPVAIEDRRVQDKGDPRGGGLEIVACGSLSIKQGFQRVWSGDCGLRARLHSNWMIQREPGTLEVVVWRLWFQSTCLREIGIAVVVCRL